LRRGVLVAIEGIDGAGKTSVAIGLVRKLRSLGIEAVYTREPLETPFIDALKRMERTVKKFRAYIASMAMLADRAIHTELVIEPLLNKGYVVVCDRYKYSTIAYQGAMGMDIDVLMQLSRVFPDADVAIYLRVSVQTAIKRIMGRRGRLAELFEREEFLVRVMELYDLMAKKGLLEVVDAERPLESVIDECYRLVVSKIRALQGPS